MAQVAGAQVHCAQWPRDASSMRQIVQLFSLGDTSVGDILLWHLNHHLRHEEIGQRKKLESVWSLMKVYVSLLLSFDKNINPFPKKTIVNVAVKYIYN
jgi:hypothetical protein